MTSNSKKDLLLGFLNAKAGNYDEVKKEIKTFHKLLADLFDSEEDYDVESFFPLLRKLDASSLPIERTCLHLIYQIMCRTIPAAAAQNSNENSERWLRTISELVPNEVVLYEDPRSVTLAIRACQAILNSGRVGSIAKRRFADTLRRLLFDERLVANMVSQLSHQSNHHNDQQQQQQQAVGANQKLWSSMRTTTTTTPTTKQKIEYNSPEVISICETSIHALAACLPESFAAVTKNESLVLVNALNQPHNPIAEACLMYFASVTQNKQLVLEVSKKNLFASPPTCSELSSIHARLFYQIVSSICLVQNNEHTSAFATLCHCIQHDDRLEVTVFVCNQLAALPWFWLFNHRDKVLTDIVYKLSTALVSDNVGLVFEACEAIQSLGKCKSAAPRGGNKSDMFLAWTGKLGRLCQHSALNASAATALAWVGNPHAVDIAEKLKLCPQTHGNQVCFALLQRCALENDNPALLQLCLDCLWYFRINFGAGHRQVLANVLLLPSGGGVNVLGALNFLDFASSVGNTKWEAALWELLLVTPGDEGSVLQMHQDEVVFCAERSLCFASSETVQRLAGKVLIKLALLQQKYRFAVYQVLHEFAQSQVVDFTSTLMLEVIVPALHVLDMVFAAHEAGESDTATAELVARSLGVCLPIGFTLCK